MRRPTLPISLYLANKTVLVIVDGDSGIERAKRLKQARAKVVEVQIADYHQALLKDTTMVIAQTGDAQRDAQIVQDARDYGVGLCYAHDQPQISDFAMPALIGLGPLRLAISTDALAPALARRVREQLQPLFDAAAPGIASLISDLTALRNKLPQGHRRAKQLYEIASRLRISGHISIDTTSTEVTKD